jgi:hypothetical protein
LIDPFSFAGEGLGLNPGFNVGLFGSVQSKSAQLHLAPLLVASPHEAQETHFPPLASQFLQACALHLSYGAATLGFFGSFMQQQPAELHASHPGTPGVHDPDSHVALLQFDFVVCVHAKH